MMTRGALIVLEGVDRCGKTSQTFELVKSLAIKQIAAERLAFPDRTTLTGQLISKYLKEPDCKLSDQAIHLLFSANRWENVEKLKEKLDSGTTLILDRYSYSGVAFSVAKGMNFSWCMNPEIGLPKPDAVYYLDVNAETQKCRPGFGGERYEISSIQNNVNMVFNKLAETEHNWNVVDANDSFENVHKKLLSSIELTISNIQSTREPLKYFQGIEDHLKVTEE